MRIFLTGATGALGPHLVAELLRAGAERIDVLIRPSHTPVSERFDEWENVVARLGGDTIDLSRVFPRVGDLSIDRFGLSRDDEKHLTDHIDLFIHAAADTRFRECPQAQRAANVDGTTRMLDLARRCKNLRGFLHVSTTCVAGRSAGFVRESLFDTPPEFLNRYEATKWEAEQLVAQSNLPAQIARVSIVMGSHIDGFVHRMGALHHALGWFGRGLIPLMPGVPQSRVDLIASETAAACLARAASSDAFSTTPPIWHCAAGQHAPLHADVCSFIWDQFSEIPNRGPAPTICDLETFQRSMASHVFESIDTFLPGFAYAKILETARAQQLFGDPLPLYDWRTTLGRVIRYCHARTMRIARRRSQISRPGMPSSLPDRPAAPALSPI